MTEEIEVNIETETDIAQLDDRLYYGPPLPNNEANYLVINGTNYHPYFFSESFDYNTYYKFLNYNFSTNLTNIPIEDAIKFDLFNNDSLINRIDIRNIKNFDTPEDVWKFINLSIFKMNFFKKYSKIALELEYGRQFCLTLIQFSKIFGFLRGFVFKKSWVAMTQFNNLVFENELYCNYCPGRFKVFIDTLHNLIFVKCLVEHYECWEKHKKQIFPVIKKLYSVYNSVEKINLIFNKTVLNRFGIGFVNDKNSQQWKNIYFNKQLEIEKILRLNESSNSNLNDNFSIISRLINENNEIDNNNNGNNKNFFSIWNDNSSIVYCGNDFLIITRKDLIAHLKDSTQWSINNISLNHNFIQNIGIFNIGYDHGKIGCYFITNTLNPDFLKICEVVGNFLNINVYNKLVISKVGIKSNLIIEKNLTNFIYINLELFTNFKKYFCDDIASVLNYKIIGTDDIDKEEGNESNEDDLSDIIKMLKKKKPKQRQHETEPFYLKINDNKIARIVGTANVAINTMIEDVKILEKYVKYWRYRYKNVDKKPLDIENLPIIVKNAIDGYNLSLLEINSENKLLINLLKSNEIEIENTKLNNKSLLKLIEYFNKNGFEEV